MSSSDNYDSVEVNGKYTELNHLSLKKKYSGGVIGAKQLKKMQKKLEEDAKELESGS